ncbi:hypothetical protein QJV38_14120 [Listeria cossartiae subsp. cayugensis]|uniref:Uncharacterized protein n=1 Tax=Listeria cossartiae subsp. cayugensis TaxID=2713505 RepID=A0ABU2IRH2_9LIST|nr:hypothetical protein [Listeria cossartiae]MDT0067300.1 hypothetical protein [Listeria cossartiae subsp. cayugensis]MDT0081147.1 hypothetical protein [Listeria cossartiae subsp. cayugensis]MDT0083983.1 hypothetical protein [Listeria cossartiae subsp. cayugensis]MDT0089549.1 hypothetical protein [Listeria cossartiae subsp. cayugensis]MDT0100619.1 hypothetical protein [Listeria cossartiae subsp. cayugensis]
MNKLLFWRQTEDVYIDEKEKKERKKYTKDGERRYKYLAAKVVRFYYIAFSISILIVLTTFTIAIFNANKYDVVDSGNGVEAEQKMAGTTLFLADRTYHPNTNQAEFLFQVSREPIYQKQPIQMVVAERKTKKELKSKLLELSEEYMLVIVNDVPENWKEIVFDFGENELFIDTNTEVKTSHLLTKGNEEIIKEGEMKQCAFSFSELKTPKEKGHSNMTDDDYLRYYAEKQIEAADDLMIKYAKDITALEKDVEHMDNQIEQLKGDKKYQTETTQLETDNSIKSIQNEQGKIHEKVQETKLGIKQLNDRKGKLEEWISDHPS